MKVGIYQVYWGGVGGGQRYIGEVAQLLSSEHEVEVIHHCAGFDRCAVEEALGLDLARVSFRCVPPVERPAWTTRNPYARLRLERELRAEISRPYDLFIDNSDIPPLFCHSTRGALIVHFPLVSFEEFHGYATDAWRQRPAFLKWAMRLLHRREWTERLGGYQVYLVNSEYGRRWLERRWGLAAKVLNPPLRDGFRPKDKERLVLMIGAFRDGAHKRHAVSIDVFKSLCDRGLRGWRYVIAGACGSAPRDQAYLQALRDLAAGYPIELQADLDGAELRSLLETASILWHSMGYGVDEQREPWLMEHFGMVAPEAMAAGAVPVVFNGGGLREIVDHGRTGFLWRTTDELANSTLRLVQNEALQAELRANALADVARYSKQAFATRLHEVLAPVLS